MKLVKLERECRVCEQVMTNRSLFNKAELDHAELYMGHVRSRYPPGDN